MKKFAIKIFSWRYEDITSSPKFLSIAAIYKCMIVGILVAEFKSWATLSKEDRIILVNTVGKNRSVAYILSLGEEKSNFTSKFLQINYF